MATRLSPDQKRTELLEGTIRAVAKKGLENASTRDICDESGINVAYIYHFFADKEDMLTQAFEESDERFLRVILDNLPVLRYTDIDYEQRCRMLFDRCWEYILERPDRLLFYMRYYFSSLYTKYAVRAHTERYHVLVERMSSAFPEGEDVMAILRQLLSMLLNALFVQVTAPTDESNVAADKCFAMIFSIIRAYIKKDTEAAE